MAEINSLSDESLRKIAALLRQSGYTASPTSSSRNAQIVDDSSDVELWGYTVGPATAAVEADDAMTPGEGVLQVHRRKTGSNYTSTAEFIEFQNFGGEIEDGVWLSIKRDRAARRWVTKEPAVTSTDEPSYVMPTVDACGTTFPQKLLMTGVGTDTYSTLTLAVVLEYSETLSAGTDHLWVANSSSYSSSVDYGFHPILGGGATVKQAEITISCPLDGGGVWNAHISDGDYRGGDPVNVYEFFNEVADDEVPPFSWADEDGMSGTMTISVEALPSSVTGHRIVDTAAGWAAKNVVLPDGYVGVESDTNKEKNGDGSTAWNSLAYSYDGGEQTETNTTKLDGIETGATADQTGAEIKAAYEAEADTNAFTDSEKTLLGNQSGTNTGDQDLSDYQLEPSEGAFANGDKTKLDGIESGATADQDLSGYQLQPSEGAFVDGDKTKLDGIETAADVTDATNVTAAGALMDSEITNLAAVKAFDPTDYATATGLSDHIADASDAHDASAISVADSGALLTATDVEGALAEIAGEVDTNTTGLSDHLADSSDAHDASAISVADSGAIYTATDVEAALAEVKAIADSALQDITSENLTDLADVDTDKSKTPADGDVLTYDGTDWNAETPTGGGTTLPSTKCRDTTAGQAIGHGTSTKLNLTVTDWDDDGIENIASNEITVDADGKYLIIASWGVIDSNSEQILAGIGINGTVVLYCGSGVHSGSVGAAVASGLFELEDGDDISIYGYSLTDNSSAVLTSSFVTYQPRLQVVRLS